MPQDYSSVAAVYPLQFYAIVGVDTVLETFVISGDHTLRFLVADTFVVVSSTGNDGTFTVLSTAFASGPNQTTITVNENITDATVDGTILHDEISDFLDANDTNDTVADRDLNIPIQFAGAHAQRLSNEIRELNRNANQGLGFSVIDGGGLIIYFGSGTLVFGSGPPFDGVPGILTMTDNTTNFIEVDSAAVVTSNAVAFSSGKFPLFKVTTLAADITKIEDKRSAIYIAEFAEATLDNFGPKFDPTTELTIAAGVITVTQGMHTVDTESDAASDDLDTINGTTDGLLLMIRAENTARTVVIKDGTGNIELSSGDIALTDTKQFVHLQFDDGLSKWVLVSGTGTATVPVHATTHVRAGSDEIDGDTLDIDFTPLVYTPSTSPPEVTNVDELTAHLKGIDDQLTDKTADTHLFIEPDDTTPAEVFNNDIKLVELPDGGTKGVIVALPISAGGDFTVNKILTLGLVVTGIGAADANVKIDLDIKHIAVGELTSKADDENLSNIVAITNTLDQMHTTTFTIDVSLAAPGDIASIHITREGGDAADTFTGMVGIVKTVLVVSTRK